MLDKTGGGVKYRLLHRADSVKGDYIPRPLPHIRGFRLNDDKFETLKFILYIYPALFGENMEIFKSF